MALYWADLIEAFPGRFISEIRAEMERLPIGLMSDVFEARAYRQAKQMRESAEQSSNPGEAIKALPQTKLMGLVPDVEWFLRFGRWPGEGGEDG